MSTETEIKGASAESIKYTYKPFTVAPRPPYKHPATIEAVECPYAKIVAVRVAERAHEGMKKYGVTMARTDVSTVGWIDHAIEEALDLAVYLTKLKDNINKEKSDASSN